ncbi:sulfotransferase [Moorena producens]|uniref:sulfotransferase n=1 Tax=Moorena producens TaxID=1155739 RepID=UPI003C76C169
MDKKNINFDNFLASVRYKLYYSLLPQVSSAINGFNRTPNYSNILVITGSPRSGTTWLAEVLSKVTDFPILWEPLFPNEKNIHIHNVINFERIYFKDNEKEKIKDDLFKYMFTVFSGRQLNPTTLRNCDLLRSISPKGWVVKFCLATPLIPWINDSFPLIKPIIIVRHPCAVIASQIKWGWWKKWQNYDPLDLETAFSPVIPTYALDTLRKVVREITTFEEILSVVWCLDNLRVLREDINPSNLIIPYECIVADGEKSILRILSHVKQINLNSKPKSIESYLYKFSSTTHHLSSFNKGNRSLNRWREELSHEQIKKIMKIVNDFEINLYE